MHKGDTFIKVHKGDMLIITHKRNPAVSQYGDVMTVNEGDEQSIEAAALLLEQAAQTLKVIAKDGKSEKLLKFEIISKPYVEGFHASIGWKATIEEKEVIED